MGKGKHSATAKHSAEPPYQKESFNFIKFIFKVFILFMLIGGIYFLFDIYLKIPSVEQYNNTKNSISNTDSETEIYQPTEKVEVETILTVKGAEYLEITGIHINTDNPELSTVTAKLKNNSDQSYENVNLRISLFDKDNIEITFLDYKIDKIEANSEATTFAALKRDLSNCENYSIALKKNN